MKNKYYDEWEFKKISDLIEIDPYLSKIKLEQYIEQYPKDYCALAYYAYNLVVIGEDKKAEQILNFVESNSKFDKQFLGHSKGIGIFKNNLFLDKLRLLSYQERYSEILDMLYFRKCKKTDTFNLSMLELICRKKLGIITTDKNEQSSYLVRQIIDYSEKEFLEHIEKHLSDSNLEQEELSTSVFAPNFPIDKVITEIKKYFLSEKRVFPGLWEDQYIFKYDECGKDNNRLTDFFKVYTFHNTSDIITMCPSCGVDKFSQIDLNYLKPKEVSKVKQLSRVDRFNMKYGRIKDTND